MLSTGLITPDWLVDVCLELGEGDELRCLNCRWTWWPRTWLPDCLRCPLGCNRDLVA